MTLCELVLVLWADACRGTSSKPANVLQCSEQKPHMFSTYPRSHVPRSDRVLRLELSYSLTLHFHLEYLSSEITRLLINTVRPINAGYVHHMLSNRRSLVNIVK